MARLEAYLADTRQTQAEFADKVNSTPSTISRICSGKRFPGRELLRRIAQETQGAVTANDFLGIDFAPISNGGENVSSPESGKNRGVTP